MLHTRRWFAPAGPCHFAPVSRIRAARVPRPGGGGRAQTDAALTKAAERENVSLNQFITDSLASVVGWRRGPTSSEATSAPAPINQEPGAAGLTAKPIARAQPPAPRRPSPMKPRLLTAALTANFLLVAVAGTIAILVLIAARS